MSKQRRSASLRLAVLLLPVQVPVQVEVLVLLVAPALPVPQRPGLSWRLSLSAIAPLPRRRRSPDPDQGRKIRRLPESREGAFFCSHGSAAGLRKVGEDRPEQRHPGPDQRVGEIVIRAMKRRLPLSRAQ